MRLNTRISAYVLAFALAGTSSAFSEQKAEVIHWWTSAGESASVKVFADQFGKAGGTWVDNAIAGGANARRRNQPHRRRQSPDHDAVQHRQAVR
jgi:glucose/mannose transport system substrate-binding protein